MNFNPVKVSMMVFAISSKIISIHCVMIRDEPFSFWHYIAQFETLEESIILIEWWRYYIRLSYIL